MTRRATETTIRDRSESMGENIPDMFYFRTTVLESLHVVLANLKPLFGRVVCIKVILRQFYFVSIASSIPDQERGCREGREIEGRHTSAEFTLRRSITAVVFTYRYIPGEPPCHSRRASVARNEGAARGRRSAKKHRLN